MELDNFDKYSEYTGKGDWKAICDLNNVSFDTLGLRIVSLLSVERK